MSRQIGQLGKLLDKAEYKFVSFADTRKFKRDTEMKNKINKK